MLTLGLKARAPSPQDTYATLLRVAVFLGARCWLHGRRFHFPVADGWTIAVSADSGNRFRLDACRFVRPVSTLWVLAGEDERLAGCVLALRDQIVASAASNGGGVHAFRDPSRGSQPMS